MSWLIAQVSPSELSISTYTHRTLILLAHCSSNLKAETYEPEKFRRLIDINVIGSFLVAQATARTMIKSGNGGSIIFVASMSGRIVNYPQEQSAYNASKAAVIQLGKSLAAEWAPYGIRVNCISPGYMDTALNRVPALDAQKKIWRDLTPQKRLGQVDELNSLAVFLASDASSFMTGADCIIDVSFKSLRLEWKALTQLECRVATPSGSDFLFHSGMV
jgi:NAD(P)-dependent dehydrogenase (short-subunit alcohol dehydrogenase family)